MRFIEQARSVRSQHRCPEIRLNKLVFLSFFDVRGWRHVRHDEYPSFSAIGYTDFPSLPTQTRTMTRTVVFLVFPGFQLLDVAGPIAAFEMANRFAPGSYRLRLVSLKGGLVESSASVSLLSARLDDANEVNDMDTLIAAGGEGVMQAADCPPTLAFIRQSAPQARRVASVCSGAYLLAAAGLLSGKQATTHWQHSADFTSRFPDVCLDADRIYVNDGKLWTSAGISAGIDLSLALITEDLGDRLARQVAHQLVVYYRRHGGQSQYSALLDMDRGNGRFAPLLDYIRSHLGQSLKVHELADQAGMSARNFARAFAAEVGITPARAVERLRVEAASASLESGHHSVQAVARQCGFSDAEQMRRAFIRLKGVSPSALKRHWGL